MFEFLNVLSADVLTLASGSGGVSLKGVSDFFLEQLKYVLYIILGALLILAFVRRAWLFAAGIVVGTALLGFFIEKPDTVVNLGEWLAGLLMK